MTATGEKIHQLRLKNSLTLEQLAAKIGTTKGHVWALENTTKNYSAKKLHAIALALGVSVEFLWTTQKASRKSTRSTKRSSNATNASHRQQKCRCGRFSQHLKER